MQRSDYLDTDDMPSPSKFDGSQELASILLSILYFTDQHLTAFNRLLCKMANLRDIELNLLGPIPNVNVANPAKLRRYYV